MSGNKLTHFLTLTRYWSLDAIERGSFQGTFEEAAEQLGQGLLVEGDPATLSSEAALAAHAVGNERLRVEPWQHGRRGRRLQVVDHEDHLARRGG